MSRSPSGTSASSSSSSWACRRWARNAPRRWMPTSAGGGSTGIALDDLVRDPRQRAPHFLLAEDDLLVRCPSFPSWPLGTGLKESRRMYQVDATASAGRRRARSATASAASASAGARAPGAPTSARARRRRARGTGTSIVSKSRGASVAANTARASLAQLAAGVAAGDVGQREQPHLGVARQLGRLAGGAVGGLARALGLLLGEGRLVDEHVGLVGRDRERLAGRRVAGDDDLAALPRRRPSPARARRRRPSRRAAARRSPGPGVTPSSCAGVASNSPGRGVLDERVAEAAPRRGG